MDAARNLVSASPMPAAILSIQSHVVHGHVGNSAAVFALQRLGFEVWPIHTVQFSSHAGYPGWRGRAFEAGLIDECVAGLRAIQVLDQCGAVLTGYVGKAEIGEAALRAVAAVREASPGAVYACDPVIGDEGRGVYVGAGIAEFFRDRALGQAEIATPNAFEMEYLTGIAPRDAGGTRAALTALRRRGPKIVVATSLRLEDTPADALDLAVADASGAWRLRTPRLPISVHGAGDLLSALFLGHWLQTRSAAQALASAAASVYGVVAATAAAGTRELALIAAQAEVIAPSRRFAPEPL
jgi:pyridoxine kinase